MAEITVVSPDQELYDHAQSFLKKGDLLRAHEFYSRLVTDYPEFPLKTAVQNELESLNIEIIHSNLETTQTLIYVVQPRDTLRKIAQKFHTTVELLTRRNQLASDVIRIGERLSIWTGGFTITVDKSDNILVLKNKNNIVKRYPVSTGKDSTVTPVGEFVIKSRMVDPVWFHHGEIVPPGTNKNFLGTRWLGFDLPKYGIHGTVEPQLIGKSVSGGCIRMRNQDVEELYDLIPEGTKVFIQE